MNFFVALEAEMSERVTRNNAYGPRGANEFLYSIINYILITHVVSLLSRCVQ
jgi:hypothetical protein